jgi:hypothetical protein
MNEFEDALRDAMREAPREADEAFAARVDAQVARLEMRRVVGLTLAAAAAAVLTGIMIAALGPVLRGLVEGGGGAAMTPDQTLPLIGMAAPVAGVLLAAALAFPMLVRRRQDR